MSFCEPTKDKISSIYSLRLIKQNRNENEKRSQHKYQKPECTIYKLALETFVCTSVYPDAPRTTETNWEDGGEVDGGTIEF